MLSTAARLVYTGTKGEKEPCFNTTKLEERCSSIRNGLTGIQSTDRLDRRTVAHSAVRVVARGNEENVLLYVPGRCPRAVPHLVHRPVLSSCLPPGCPLS